MKILAIKFKFLGDLVLMTPALRALKERYPEAEIHLLVPSSAKAIFANHPHIDKLWTVDRKSKLSFFRTLLGLWRERFDVSVDFVGNDRGAIATLAASATMRIGAFAPKGFLMRGRCYTDLRKEGFRAIHNGEQQLELLEVLDVPMSENLEPELNIPLMPIDFELPDAFVQCHLSSSSESRDWPVEKYAEFFKRSKRKLVFTAGASPRELNKLEALKKAIPEASVLSGSLSLEELLQVTLRAEAVISPDTFIAHAAAALDKSLVCLYGPTTPEEWLPRKTRTVAVNAPACGCRDDFYNCRAATHCMRDIEVGAVDEALEHLLAEVGQ